MIAASDNIPSLEAQFLQHRVCVLIPTYNNAGTLPDVLNAVLAYTQQVIVVNDGSTDATADILQQFPGITIISYSPNRGKGFALRTGLKEASRLGYEYAITMDSDGQHYASDLHVFIDQLEKTPQTLMIGARNMNQQNVPGKSSFGNRFSNFWYWIETGHRLPDTQSGYRLYPLKKLADKAYFTRKYEFEIEIIVRAAWSGVQVMSVPISVYYPPAHERVSHFRPFKDFTRISILNTVLVLIMLFWIKPRDLVRLLVRKDGWQRIYRVVFVNPHESNHTKAASVAFGIFMGIVPLWGFQLLIGIPLALLFRLNKALFLVAANISIFPFTPVIWVASIITGNIVLGHETLVPDWHLSLSEVKRQGAAFFLGGAVLSVVAGLFTYGLTYGILYAVRKRRLSAR